MKAYPRAFLKVFWWVQAVLAVSGLLLLPGMLALRLEREVPFEWLMNSRVVLAATHGFLAFISLLVLGALLPVHVRHSLRQHNNKRSGITLLCVFALLMLTGWGIYYLADEQWSLWASLLHVLTGLLVAAAMAVHVVMARQIHAQQRDRHRRHSG
jgi:heme A synthase